MLKNYADNYCRKSVQPRIICRNQFTGLESYAKSIYLPALRPANFQLH